MLSNEYKAVRESLSRYELSKLLRKKFRELGFYTNKDGETSTTDYVIFWNREIDPDKEGEVDFLGGGTFALRIRYDKNTPKNKIEFSTVDDLIAYLPKIKDRFLAK